MPPKSPKSFKSQPWVLFDTVVARSFLLGDTTNGLAVGSQSPAVSSNGEIVFFQGGGRTTANLPWYTNLDVSGQLSYGFEVWQMYLYLAFPMAPPILDNDFNEPGAAPLITNVPPTVRLAEAIINFGVLEFTLGQENQTRWPLHRFGAGGGLHVNATGFANVQNSEQQQGNVLALPEPIEMPRTQNLNCKIRLAAEILSLIGTAAAPGVGAALVDVDYTIDGSTTTLTLPPYAIQLGLKGRRIKHTQYGQIPSAGDEG